MDAPVLPQNTVFSVSQITDLIKEILETSFRTIIIEGEISNWRPSAAGHIYFTLKDNNAQIKAVIFRGAAMRLTFRPKDGDKVRRQAFAFMKGIVVNVRGDLLDHMDFLLCDVVAGSFRPDHFQNVGRCQLGLLLPGQLNLYLDLPIYYSFLRI